MSRRLRGKVEKGLAYHDHAGVAVVGVEELLEESVQAPLGHRAADHHVALPLLHAHRLEILLHLAPTEGVDQLACCGGQPEGRRA